MPDALPPQTTTQPPPRSLLHRVNLMAVTVAALAGIVTSLLTLKLAHRHDTALIRLETVRVVVEAIKESRDEDPSVAASMSEALRNAGQRAAASTLDSVVARRARARGNLVPVALPRHPDSSRALLARIDDQLSKQPAIPSRLIVHQGSRAAERAEIRVIPVPAGDTTVNVPDAGSVGVGSLGALWRDGEGRYWCGGTCKPGQVCCQIVVAAH